MRATATDVTWYAGGVNRTELEDEVYRLSEAGDHHAATTSAIRGLGPELLGFLVVLVGASDAGDVFADVCVRMWKSLPKFRWESSLRTWVYVLARRAAHGHRVASAEQRARFVRISEVAEIDDIILNLRTTTLARLREERKTRGERLRAQLTLDEQTLLVLRVDRELEWRDIARVLADDDAQDEADLVRTSAGLRKRFERLKVKLHQLAAEDPGD